MARESKALKGVIDTTNLVCWAIDAGTSRSGACFSLPSQPERFLSGMPSKDQVIKIPTDILIERVTKKFVAFGDEAIRRYHMEGEEGEIKFALFEKFKMQLYRDNKLLTERPSVKSVCGTMTISAVEAFGYVFQFFRKCAEEIFSKNATFLMTDIQWVITVPAIWSDGAKQVMVEAAKKGGLTADDTRITICLEPTAASMWAFHTLAKEDPTMITPGTKCLTLDAGGGTIDIMLFEVLKNQEIKKLAPESGGGWGSTYIDKEFERMLDDVFGQRPMASFRATRPTEYHEMMNQFEAMKVTLTPDDLKDPNKAFTFNISDLVEFLQEKHDIDASALIQERGAAYDLSSNRKRLKVSVKTMMKFFQKQIDFSVEHLKKLLSGHKDVKFIYMVGGFSNSDVLFTAIKKEFEQAKYGAIRVVRPPQPGEAIAMGAALFARKQTAIKNVIKDVSYGIQINCIFDPTKHDPKEKFTDPLGKERAHNCFFVFLKKGESYDPEHSLVNSFCPSQPRQTSITFPVYTSDKVEPVHTTERGCKKLGEVTVPTPIPSHMQHASDEELLNRSATVELIFQGERLRVIATYSLTGESAMVDLDYFV